MNRAFIVALFVLGCSSSSETCSQMASCASGSGSYKLCTSGSSCRYLASDGTSFDCGSCADCQAAASKALAWCSGASGGCVTPTVCANSAKDCAAGQRCNTALSPPVCQALYCGAAGTPCDGDSANDLCASRMCGPTGVCVTPPDMAISGSSCCASNRPGNELGVGKSCTLSSDCSGQSNLLCTTVVSGKSTGYCTLVCSTSNDCGSNATCMTNGSMAGACIPTNCDTTGCF